MSIYSESLYDDIEAVTRRSKRQLNQNDSKVPWGTGLVEGAKDLAGRAIGQLQEWAKEDPDTWTDDLLRLTGRGVKGLGDTIEKITTATGIKKFIHKVTGGDCGCDKRKQMLNKVFPYKKNK